MAKKAVKRQAADGKLSKAEAIRQGWKELGREVPNTMVISWVKEKHGLQAASSEVSSAKKKLFGGGKKGRKQKLRMAKPAPTVKESLQSHGTAMLREFLSLSAEMQAAVKRGLGLD